MFLPLSNIIFTGNYIYIIIFLNSFRDIRFNGENNSSLSLFNRLVVN